MTMLEQPLTMADKIQVVIAIVTFFAVLVALFGDWLKSKLFRPKLRLDLSDRRGIATVARLDDHQTGESRYEDARYWFLTVSNGTAWPVAERVWVCLMQLAERDAGNAWRPNWSGEMPIRWDVYEVHGDRRDIGLNAEAALLAVVKDKFLDLLPNLYLNNLKWRYRQAEQCHIRATFQARGRSAVSNLLTVEIHWDGGWDDSSPDMCGHLKITIVDPAIE